jgi:TM2 domain-containing membrane protein YozV
MAMEKVWVVRDPDEEIENRKTKLIREEEPLPEDAEQKNPAVAYSLSIFFWGGGQIYNGETGKGLLFLLSMLLLTAGAVFSFLYRHLLFQFLRERGILLADVFLALEVLFFCLLFIWICNAGQAYHKAVQARTTPFPGVNNRACPFLCSMLIPGWGQFLNGQPLKGSIFTGFSLFSLFAIGSISAILLAWPLLEASNARFIIESILAITILFTPLIPFIWVLSSFDALQVSLDDIKKEPLIDRLKYANNRRRTQGWMRGVFPHLKVTVALLLFLILLLLVAEQSFPRNYYSNQLATIQVRLQEQGMTLAPDLVHRVRTAMVRMGM